jgi:hypothetical protein
MGLRANLSQPPADESGMCTGRPPPSATVDLRAMVGAYKHQNDNFFGQSVPAGVNTGF